MYCANCGTQLPDDANFCMKCGKAQKPDVQVRGARWEVCAIEVELVTTPSLFGQGSLRLIARAIGPQGTFIASATEAQRKDTSEIWKEMEPTLISELLKEGWEPVLNTSTSGLTDWIKFRRQLRD